MIEKVRKPGRAKNIVAVVLFGIICFVFVFVGMDRSRFDGGAVGGPVAMVNREPINFLDFHERFSRMQEQYKSQFEKLPGAQRQEIEKSMKSRALEELINAEVVSQAAEAQGIYASDSEVRDYITSIPFFKKDDRFNRQYYDNYLQYRKMSAERFEDEIRKEISINKLRDLFNKSMLSTQLVKTADMELGKREINVQFLRLDQASLGAKLKVTPEEEKRFAADPTNEAALRNQYEASKSKYQTEEQVRARHILVKFDANKPGDQEKALEKIKEIKKSLNDKNFAEIATGQSEDTGSASKGGDLGFFGRGKMVPEFEDVAFLQEVGKVSEPVKSAFGYHLIKVEEKTPAKTSEFETVKDLVAGELLQEKKYSEAVADLEKALADGQKSAVEAWVKKNGLALTETGLFKLDQLYIPKLGDDEALLAEVLKLKTGGAYVNKLVASKGSKYILQLKEVKVDNTKAQELVNATFDMRQNRSSSDVFNLWAEDQKAKAKIERSGSI